MNDFMEMHWGYSIFEQAASELLKSIPKDFFDHVDGEIASTGGSVLPLVSCFSLDGDVLSQWRAYSDDGKGFAVGFSASDLVQMPVRPLRVLYDRRNQVDELKAVLLALYEVEKGNGLHYGDDFRIECRFLALDLCALKNPAFQEEKEIRLAHAVNFVDPGGRKPIGGKKLVSVGGTAWGRSAKAEEIKFRMKGEIPVSHVAIDFTNSGRTNPIKKIMLGPKNQNLSSNIGVYLNTVGIHGVTVEKSAASYV